MADQSRIAQQFKALYIRALTDVENGKAKPPRKRDEDYARVSNFINDLKRAKDIRSLDTCISQYLKIYLNYSPGDRRSKMAIFHLLTSRIYLSPSGDKHLGKLSHELEDPAQPFTTLRVRFQDLENDQKGQIHQLLQEKSKEEKEHEREVKSLLDLLRDEYIKQNGQAAKNHGDLYDFNPAPNESLKGSLEKQLGEVKQRWTVCTADNSPENLEALHKSIDKYQEYIAGLLKQGPLQAFQVIKYLQDRIKTRSEKDGKQIKTTSGDRSELMCELYTIACIRLLVWGSGVKLLQKNRLGFTKEEQDYFLRCFRDNPPYRYVSNLENRFASELRNVPALFDQSKAFLDLILLTKNQLKPADLVNLQETLRIQNIWKDIKNLTDRLESQDEAGQRRLLADAKNLQTLEKLKEILEIEVPIGERGPELGKGFAHVNSSPGAHQMFGEITIVYIDPRTLRHFYIEYAGLKPHLFLVDKSYITSKLYSSRIKEIYLSTVGMVFVTQFMFLMMGFMVPFVEAGFAGLVQEMIIFYASSKLEEQAEKINPTFGKIVGLAAMIVAPRRSFKPKVVEPVSIAPAEAPVKVFITEVKGTTATEARGTAQVDEAWLNKGTGAIDAEQRGLGKGAVPVEAAPTRPQHQQLQQQQTRALDAGPPARSKPTETAPIRPRQQQQLQPTGVRLKQASSETAQPKEVSSSSVEGPAAKGTNRPGTQPRGQGQSTRNTAESGVEGNRGIPPGTLRFAGGRGQNYRISGDMVKLERSKLGHHVYEYLDEHGRLLYVGKSGSMAQKRTGPLPKGQPEPEFANWVDRLNKDHIKKPWINRAKYVRVTYDLSEPEMWALEEVRIDQNQGSAANWNYREGEFSSRLGKHGADLHANSRSAQNHPTITFTIDASSGSYY